MTYTFQSLTAKRKISSRSFHAKLALSKRLLRQFMDVQKTCGPSSTATQILLSKSRMCSANLATALKEDAHTSLIHASDLPIWTFKSLH